MQKKYVYNKATHCLHIVGYCPWASGGCDNMIYFNTEDEALAYDGRAVGLCKRCQKKRESMQKNK